MTLQKQLAPLGKIKTITKKKNSMKDVSYMSLPDRKDVCYKWGQRGHSQPAVKSTVRSMCGYKSSMDRTDQCSQVWKMQSILTGTGDG